MRNIKFRAWDKPSKSMVYFDQFFKSTSLLPTPQYYPFSSWESAVPMQYTGLKDRHGKEIYEGDIVAVNEQPDSFIMQCVWSDWFFGFGLIYPDKPEMSAHTLFSNNLPALEVIGNVFENKDLLK